MTEPKPDESPKKQSALFARLEAMGVKWEQSPQGNAYIITGIRPPSPPAPQAIEPVHPPTESSDEKQ